MRINVPARAWSPENFDWLEWYSFFFIWEALSRFAWMNMSHYIFFSLVQFDFSYSSTIITLNLAFILGLSTLRLNYCYLKIIHILHSSYHLKIIGHILKTKQTNKCVCIHDITQLIIMKMKVKMKIYHMDTT